VRATLLGLCLLSLHFISNAQYWQQRADFKIAVKLDDQKNTLTGMEELVYTNNSPDALPFIWFHIWPNAYRDEKTAFAKQLGKDDEGKKRLKNFKDRGWIEGLDFTVDGAKANFETHESYNDVIKLLLPSPLAPGKSVRIATPFVVDIPEYISRSGRSGASYMICQWFPKPAVYDRKGWHPIPYLDQGEFYSEYGSYDVNITLPSSYIVGATGTLQGEEYLRYKEIGTKNRERQAKKNIESYKTNGAEKTLRFLADSVVDFAWFADKDFVIRYDTMKLASSKLIDVFTFHHPDGNSNWVNSTDYVKSGARAYSAYLGEYPYRVVQAVEGPKNETSGGMEYPTITLITSPEAGPEYLDAVITHEVGHNWFMSILASNERQHAWMDEGINTYFQFRYEAEKYRANSIFGNALPEELKKKSVDEFQQIVYNALNKLPMEGAIDIPATEYPNKEQYGLVTYVKTAVWLYVMEVYLGRETVDKALQAYYNDWKFKHPYPEDLRASMEKETGQDLQKFFELLNKKGGL